jgi:hypothetical protein
MNYTVITKLITEYKSNNQFIDLYTYAFIKYKSDNITGTSFILNETISRNLKIPERTLSEIISRLEKYKSLLTIERKPIKEYVEKGQYFISKNIYHFNINPTNFYFLDNSFFDLELPNEIKGFLLKLKSVCKNDTNKYIAQKPYKKGINKAELAKLLQTDVKTLNRLLSECETLGQIKPIENGLLITNKCFLLSVKNTIENTIYNTIYNFCIEKGTTPPEKDIKAIVQIKYYLDMYGKELTTLLNERCKSLPQSTTLDYFLKVLHIAKSQKRQSDFILIM